MRRRWWVGGLLAAWAVGLLVAAIWSSQHDPATVRDQSDLDSGRQTLEQAIATVVQVAGAAATPEVLPPELTSGCQITVSRSGSELGQTVVLTVPVGDESTLLSRLAAGLPAEWGARYHQEANRFRADAGDFVAIRGEVTQPGQVRLTADTGCRPADG